MLFPYERFYFKLKSIMTGNFCVSVVNSSGVTWSESREKPALFSNSSGIMSVTNCSKDKNVRWLKNFVKK